MISGYTHALLLTPYLLRVSAMNFSGNDIVVTFNAIATKSYRLERKLALSETSWQSIPNVSDFTATSDGPAQITDIGARALGAAFYRVRLLP